MKEVNTHLKNLHKFTFHFLSFSLLLITSCYDPDDSKYEPTEYLESEFFVDFGFKQWTASESGITLSFTNQNFFFYALNTDKSQSIGSGIRARNNGSFYKSGKDEISKETIESGEYKTNDTLSVSFTYQESKSGIPLSEAGREINEWDDADPEYCSFVLDEMTVYDGEIYLSGSFKARVFRSYDNKLSPAYLYFNGYYKNVRVTKIYSY